MYFTIITADQRQKNVAREYKNKMLSIFKEKTWPFYAKETYKRIKKAKTIEEINIILGNNSWTNNTCDSCGKDQYVIISSKMGGQYCQNCLKKALQELAEYTKELIKHADINEILKELSRNTMLIPTKQEKERIKKGLLTDEEIEVVANILKTKIDNKINRGKS